MNTIRCFPFDSRHAVLQAEVARDYIEPLSLIAATRGERLSHARVMMSVWLTGFTQRTITLCNYAIVDIPTLITALTTV